MTLNPDALETTAVGAGWIIAVWALIRWRRAELARRDLLCSAERDRVEAQEEADFIGDGW